VGGPRSVVGVSLGTLLLALWEILLEDYSSDLCPPLLLILLLAPLHVMARLSNRPLVTMSEGIHGTPFPFVCMRVPETDETREGQQSLRVLIFETYLG
jgi:hypothetical protein